MRKINHSSAMFVLAVTICVTGSLITMAVLLWASYSGFKLATDSSTYAAYTDWPFQIGVLTMLLGFLFMILSLPILADLILNFSEQFQEEAGTHRAKERTTICKAIAGIFKSMIAMFILCWTIYTGFRLLTEARRDSEYYLLTLSLGIVSIIFGLIYFVIGIPIIAEQGINLLSQLQQERKWNQILSRSKQ